MGHCRGNGADSFGQPQQGRGGLESAVFDTKHDAFLAIRDWRVNGTKPEYLIAAKYKNGANATDGIAFTRKLCPYPLVSARTLALTGLVFLLSAVAPRVTHLKTANLPRPSVR